MKRIFRHITAWSLIVLAGGGALFYLTRPQPVKVVVEAAETGIIESTVVNTRAGTVKACRRALLAPAVGGQIADLPVREGMRVEKGELLLALWNDDLQAEVLLRESEITAARESAEAACLRADVAQRQANRISKLQEQNAIAEEEVDQANTAAKALRADCESARAAVKVSLSRLQTLKEKLEQTVVHAPFAGVVAEVNGEKGEYVTPSPPGIPTLPVIDLVDNSCFYVTVPIDEVDAPRVKLGMEARITLDAFGEQVFPAKVRRIADYVLEREKQARTVDVEADFSDPSRISGLMPGYSADAEIIIDVRHGVLRIPSEAVFDTRSVLVYLPGKKILQERSIETGLRNWDLTEVISGLEEGELVVISVGREGVEDGAAAIMEEDAVRND